MRRYREIRGDMQLAAQLDAGRPRADHHEGELLPPLLLAQARQRGLLEGVAQLLAKRNRVRELLHEEAVLLDSFDAKRVRRRADGHDELVVGHLEIAQLAAHPLTHHALASDPFGDGVDRRRLRLKVGRRRVCLANRLDDAVGAGAVSKSGSIVFAKSRLLLLSEHTCSSEGRTCSSEGRRAAGEGGSSKGKRAAVEGSSRAPARLQRAEGGAREHGRKEEVVARRHDRHVARRVLQLREHRVRTPTRTQHDHPRPLSLWRRAA